MSVAVLEIPEDGPPTLAGGEQVAAAARPAQRGDGRPMTPQLPRDAHGLEVPDDDGAVDATGGEVVAPTVEAQTCRVTGADRVGDVLGVVLQQVVVGEQQIHVDIVAVCIFGGS